MSPIKQDTIHVERWTKAGGQVKIQVIAEGDSENPGIWVHERSIHPRNVNHVKSEDRIVDVNVSKEGIVGQGSYRPTRFGVWRRLYRIEG